MASKVEVLNKALKRAISEILVKEFPDVQPLLVTDFLINPSLTAAKVFIHTTPKLLIRVEEKRPIIQAELKNYVKTRLTPVLAFIIDDNYLEHMDALFEKVDKE